MHEAGLLAAAIAEALAATEPDVAAGSRAGGARRPVPSRIEVAIRIRVHHRAAS